MNDISIPMLKYFLKQGFVSAYQSSFKFTSLHSLLFLPNIQENLHLTSESVIIPICWVIERATLVNDLKNWSATSQKLECYRSKTGVQPLKNWSATIQKLECWLSKHAYVFSHCVIFQKAVCIFWKPNETNKYTMSLTMLSYWTLNNHMVQICCLDEGHCRGIENFGGRMKRVWEVDTSVSRKCPVVGCGVKHHYPVNNS